MVSNVKDMTHLQLAHLNQYYFWHNLLNEYPDIDWGIDFILIDLLCVLNFPF